MHKIIDAHIHLDQYETSVIDKVIIDESVSTLISVSYHLASCQRNLQLAKKFPKVQPAFGWHPEQELITDQEYADLFQWMKDHQQELVAVGEVGLPYYLRQSSKTPFYLQPYIELLEEFIKFAKTTNKPIVLHAVYDDAPIVCNLLENHSITKAHFHWFKGDVKTITRMKQNGYHISITPDVLYEEEIQELVKCYPIELMMVETDGPWPFEGPFTGKTTHPSMIHDSIKKIAQIKRLSKDDVYEQILDNTKDFYQI